MRSRRSFGGQVHVRLSPEAHEDVAKEAFEKDIADSIKAVRKQARSGK